MQMILMIRIARFQIRKFIIKLRIILWSFYVAVHLAVSILWLQLAAPVELFYAKLVCTVNLSLDSLQPLKWFR